MRGGMWQVGELVRGGERRGEVVGRVMLKREMEEKDMLKRGMVGWGIVIFYTKNGFTVDIFHY